MRGEEMHTHTHEEGVGARAYIYKIVHKIAHTHTRGRDRCERGTERGMREIEGAREVRRADARDRNTHL